jgi:hypothetical protein
MGLFQQWLSFTAVLALIITSGHGLNNWWRGKIMSLTDLWEKSKPELQDKNVQQIISFAGNGKITDGSATSDEFRAFLKGISTDLIQKYADQCLQGSFSD